jgi:hypothetical protein
MFLHLVILPILTLSQFFGNPDTKGIYRTQADFDQHHLEFSAPSTSRKVHIHIHDFLGAPNVTVDSGGQKYYILKLELFGYRENKKDFRFFQDQAYEILDTVGFYLYAKSALQKNKGSAVVTQYYFSKSGSDSILPLTIDNLKQAFPDKGAFRYALDCQFGRDSRLLEYDNQLHTYKLKQLFEGL